MMGVHAYFNIWCEARAGWAVFMKRRTAVHKISALPEATHQQLLQFDDVCAICYQVNFEFGIIFVLSIKPIHISLLLQEMSSAKITRCKHYFHGVCLRKWLYVQDRCPLCHEIIMCQGTPPGTTDNNPTTVVNNNGEPDEEGVEALEDGNLPLM